MMLSPIVPGCTAALQSEIADQRARYAGERVDFHARFNAGFPESESGPVTVGLILRTLRCAQQDEEGCRRHLVVDLLDAQQESPHRLWTLLLLVAFERDLVRRRRALSGAPDAALDQIVVDTFVAAVEDLPYSVSPDDLRAHVLRTWARGLRKALGVRKLSRASRVSPVSPLTAPPPSGVACTACTGQSYDSTEVA
jgi:hypothetical protein